ncbi:hypothetical protein J6590_038414 [Homalodisca vitripennis]|nr:hypothetical protein J6590_038414 [Homalodisca vitripennis]
MSALQELCDVPHLILQGIDHLSKVGDGLIWCVVAGEEGETPAPHPNETVTRAGYKDRYLSEVKTSNSRSSEGIREPLLVLILLAKKQDVRASVRQTATRASGMSHLFVLQAGFRTQDARLSGGACTSLVVLATALVADTAPVGTASAIGHMAKPQAFKTPGGRGSFAYTTPEPPNLDVALG